jgi:hypothetical protein
MGFLKTIGLAIGATILGRVSAGAIPANTEEEATYFANVCEMFSVEACLCRRMGGGCRRVGDKDANDWADGDTDARSWLELNTRPSTLYDDLVSTCFGDKGTKKKTCKAMKKARRK